MNKQKQTILFSIIAASLLFFIVGNINLTIQIEKNQEAIDQLNKTEIILKEDIILIEQGKIKVENENKIILKENVTLLEKNNIIIEENKKLRIEIEQLKKKIEESKKIKETRPIIESTSRSKEIGWRTFKSTAYTTYANGDKYASKKYGNKTASGTSVKQGRTIAVDRKVIPLGTKVEIKFPSPYEYLNGIYTAEDTGNAIKGNKVDIYLNSLEVCKQFGIRQIKLKIL